MAANRTILILEGLPMAHLKAYVPNFPKHPWKRSQSLKLRELCPSRVGGSWFVSLQKAVFFGIFWEKKNSHGQTVHFGPHSVRHIRKAEHLRIKNKGLKFHFRHPMERQIFGDGVGLDPALILALCLKEHFWFSKKNHFLGGIFTSRFLTRGTPPPIFWQCQKKSRFFVLTLYWAVLNGKKS